MDTERLEQVKAYTMKGAEMSTEAEVEAHNRRELWRDVAACLTQARDSLGQAQSGLEDLQRHTAAAGLQPLYEEIQKAMQDANYHAGGGRA